jgi:hypothetical protein
VSLAAPASGQPSARAVAAEELFRAGRDLLAQNRFKEACEKLDASQKLDPAVGTLLSLGVCNEGLGRTASAWFAYRAAVNLASQRNDLRRAMAERHAAAIEPRLSTLSVHAVDASPTSPAQIEIDGETFTRDALSAPIAVDPGPHTVTAMAPHYRTWSTTVQVGAQHDAIAVDVPLLERLPDAAPPPSTAHRTIGIVSAAAGAVTLGVGTILGLQAIVKGREVADFCSPNSGPCSDASAVHTNDVAKTYADVSTVLIPVGAVLVAAGAYFFFTSRRDATPRLGVHAAFAGGRVEALWSW